MKKNNSSKFPDFNLLEDEINQEAYKNKLNNIVHDEEKKFRYISPTANFDFSQRKMYWTSNLERISRMLIMATEAGIIIVMYLFLRFFVFPVVATYTDINHILFLKLSIKQIILCAVLIPSCLLSLIFILPMFLVRTAGGIYSWAVAYIVITIFYFLLMESLCVVLLIMASIVKNISNLDFFKEIYIFIVIILVLSILWILASSFLIVKSDDIKKHISLEV